MNEETKIQKGLVVINMPKITQHIKKLKFRGLK